MINLFFSNTKKAIVIIFLSFLTFSMLAKEKKWENLLQGSQITVGSTLSIQDSELNNSNILATTNRNTFVELKINDYQGPYNWYNCELKLYVYPINDQGQVLTGYPIKLSVENNRYNGMGTFIDLDKHLVNIGNNNTIIGANISVVEILVLNKENNVIEQIVPTNIELKLSHEVERYYQLTQNISLISNIQPNNIENCYIIQWNSINEAEEYELEWTWVDNYSIDNLNTLLLQNQISLTIRDFELNNTRISTTNNFYKISNIYDRGYLVYRVRAVGRKIDNSNEELFIFKTNWNQTENGVLSIDNWSNKILIEPSIIGNNKINWQFQASYAEEGKKKEVVSFFDGSLRNRQTVTKINTNDKAVVGEVIYDEEGRPAIEVLPVPIASNAIKYHSLLNKNIHDKPYSFQDFIQQDSITTCHLSALGMKNNSGASLYFSENNNLDGVHKNFIPNAENFPFSQIEYSLDNTGRIKKKGGVGKSHQLGTGQEMRYFYTIPVQEELNRLFGTSVGFASHYKKNIIVDPNNQVSVSYLDPQGRTIATALSEGHPQNMEPLSNVQQTSNIVDLLSKVNPNSMDSDTDNNRRYLHSNNWGTQFDGLRYDAQKVLTGSNTNYKFRYFLNKELPFTYECDSLTSYTYPFVYKLELSMVDDCQTAEPSFTPTNYSINESSYSIDDDGFVIMSPNSNSISFNNGQDGYDVLVNEVKNYGISKKLIVDQEALEIFANDYIRKGQETGCILPLPTLNPNDSNCYFTCEQCTKYYNGETYTYNQVDYPGLTYPNTNNPSTPFTGQDAYVHQMLDSNFDLNQLENPSQEYEDLKNLLEDQYKQEWKVLLESCNSACSNGTGTIGNNHTTSINCENILSTIMDDMLPSGQYGIFQSSVDSDGNVLPFDTNIDINSFVGTLPVSVYNEGNSLFPIVLGVNPYEANWRHPHYFDINGLLDSSVSNVEEHYYDEQGNIAKIKVKNIGNNEYLPQLIAEAAVISIPNEPGYFWAEPQLLLNVSDFVNYITDNKHWTLSLVKYHPEFHYLDYQYQLCQVIDTISIVDSSNTSTITMTANSDGFDSYLGTVETYDEAKNLGLLDGENSLFDKDPFFNNVHPNDGLVLTISTTNPETAEVVETSESITPQQMLAAKRAIMLEALNNSINGYNTNLVDYSFISDSSLKGYELSNIKMLEYVYRSRFCNLPGGECIYTPQGSNFNDIINTVENTNIPNTDKDNFWQFYLTYYLGIKQKIQTSFINLYANKLGGYNDCIGNNNHQDVNKIFNVVKEYKHPKNKINSWITSTTLHLQNTVGTHLTNKQKRFIPFDSNHDSSLDASQVGEQLGAEVNANIYSQNGECPNTRDLKIFFDNALKSSSIIPIINSSGIKISPDHHMNYLTPSLLTQMGGSFNEQIKIQSIVNGNQLTFQFGPNIGTSFFENSALKLSIPTNTHGMTWSNYDNIWTILHMGNIVYTNYNSTTQEYNFNVVIRVAKTNGQSFSSNSNSSYNFIEMVFTGSTKLSLICTNNANDLVGIDPNNDASPILLDEANCDKKKLFAQGLLQIIQYMQSLNLQTFDIEGILIPIENISPFLIDYFGIANNDQIRWKNSAFLVNGFIRLTLNGFDFEDPIYNNSTFSNFYIQNLFAYNYGYSNLKGIRYTVNAENDELTSHDFNFMISTYNESGFITNKRLPIYLVCCNECGDKDSDFDGIGDDCDPCNDNLDSDGDGKRDCDDCGEIDTDNDGIEDDGVFGTGSCDPCNDLIDTDNDGIPDCKDCQPTIPYSNDIDCDGVLNENDVCPFGDDNIDTDGDGIADGCDLCPNENDTLDDDDDGIPNACDNCVSTSNTNQLDSDGDSIGDECDTYFDVCINNSSELIEFENKLKDVLNNVIQYQINNPTVLPNQYNVPYLLPTITSFYNDCELEDRFQELFTTYDVGFEGYDVLLQPDRILRRIRFKNTIEWNNPKYVGFVLTPSNFSDIPTDITYINSLTFNPIISYDNAFQYPTITINGMYGANQTPFSTNLQFKLIYNVPEFGASMSYLLHNSFCEFLDHTNQANRIAQAPIPANKPANDLIVYPAENIKKCDCIPQIPNPVSCTDKFEAYQNKINNLGLASDYSYSYENFCNLNFAYITDGYLHYLETLGIQNSEDPNFITIEEFGNTDLNYGFNNYEGIINAFSSYLIQSSSNLDPLNITKPQIILTWEEFVDDYLVSNPTICPPAPMIPIHINQEVVLENLCSVFIGDIDAVYNNAAYNEYINQLKREFKREYLQQALDNVVENFTMEYNDKEYQYTLYYYDQAGNLIQTVAPQGVNRMDSNQNTAINQARMSNNGQEIIPNHTFRTQYRYNSLNQLVWQSTPDGGETRFAYDRLGRIVASQNAKQRAFETINKPTTVLGTDLSIDSNNDIIKIGNNGWTNSNYGYTDFILSGNGYVEREIKGTLASNRLSTVGIAFEPSQNINDTYVNWLRIRYGFYHYSNDKYLILFTASNGVRTNYATNIPVNIGDVLRVERLNGKIYFFINNVKVLFGTGASQTDHKIDYFTNQQSALVNFTLYGKNTQVYNLKVVNYDNPKKFSYTRYDELGRIFEAGEFIENIPNSLTINDNGVLLQNNVSVNLTSFADNYPFNVSSSQNEVTRTTYDDYNIFQIQVDNGLLENPSYNTRNRVTAITTYPNTNASNFDYTNYETGIFYNYDIHGNVDEMVQSISNSILDSQIGYTNKRVQYFYDLISGNVNKVVYQANNDDQFIHRYNYDADNRITSVETSKDGVIWEIDASYLYYDHGPLARIVLGDKKVQGIDYAYTLHGWLKAVNSENLTQQEFDMGNDGNHVSKDAFGFSLSYYNNDYKSISNLNNQVLNITNNNTFNNGELFNGNIRRMVTSLRDLEAKPLKSQVNLYTYDQLNRIFDMQSFSVNANNAAQLSHDSHYNYDRNGNLLSLQRSAPRIVNGLEVKTPMDNFTYNYTPNTNKLTHIIDPLDANLFSEDIDNQNPNNYEYDEIGQLIKDNASSISNIEWRVDGKVKAIKKESNAEFGESNADQIVFFYDGLGNRIAKKSNLFGRNSGTQTTHYTRDAQGNVMGVYKQTISNTTSLTKGENFVDYKLNEHHIYGSSRLGIQEYNSHEIYPNFVRKVGDKQFELSNHLGNVLSVVTDRKLVQKNGRVAYTNFFEGERDIYEAYNNSDVTINEDNQLFVNTATTNSGTISNQIELLSGINYNIAMTINWDILVNPNPLIFELLNENGDIIHTQTITAPDYFQTYYLSNSTEFYRFVIRTDENTSNLEFTLDNVYIYQLDVTNDFVSLYVPEIIAFNDYYPFGSLIPTRTGSSSSYRYGFQGQEKDDEIKGEGNSLNYTFRMHDPRVGRFFAVDPLADDYPELTPYQFSSNNTIWMRELEGLEGLVATGMPMGNSGFGHGMIVSPEMAAKMPLSSKSTAMDITPFLGTGKGFLEAWTGKDAVTGESIPWWSRGLNLIPLVKPLTKLYKATKATVNLSATAKAIEKITPRMKLAEKILARKGLAKRWGIDSDYIDFESKVFTETLEKDQVLYQYRKPGTSEGSYYVKSLDVKPGDVGLVAEDYTEIYKVTVTSEKAKVLNSTHKRDAPYWTDIEDKVESPRITEGGGEQIFSRDLKNNAKFEKIEN